MKTKINLLLIIGFLFSGTLMSQGFTVRVGAGYAVPTSQDVLQTNVFIDTLGSISNENVYGTLGGGLRLSLAPGWWINEHFGVELGFTYLNSRKITALQQIVPGQTVNVIAYTNQLQLSPAIMLRSGTEGVQVYGRVGAVLPVIGTTFQEISVSASILGQTFDNFEKIANKGGLSIGFQGAIGVFYPVNDMISVYAEIEAVSLKIKSNTGETVEFVTNDVDLLESMDQIDRYTNFVDVINSTSNNPDTNPAGVDPALPLNDLSSQSPYSGAGINIGLILNLF